MKASILYISYDGMTDQLGQSQVLPYLCGLANIGYKIHLISCEKEERFAEGKQHIEHITTLHSIAWHPLPYRKWPPILSTILDINTIDKLAIKLHRTHKFDIVHCRSYISAFVGARLKNKYGLKFVFDMRGFYADERVDGKIWPQSNFLYRYVYKYFKKKEKQFLCNADAIISLTNTAAQIIQNWKLKSSPLPIHVIPCCADLTLFDPTTVGDESKSAIKYKLEIGQDDIVIGYLGAIGTWYMLPEMLSFFKCFVKKFPSAKMLFITNEPPIVIYNMATTYLLDANSIKVVAAKRSEVPQYLSVCQYSIFFITPTFSKQASSPTKQGEIMGMGIPIVCNAGVGDTDTIIKASNAGVLLQGFTENDFTAAIEQLTTNAYNHHSIRNGAHTFYSLDSGVKKYNDIYVALGLFK